VVVEHFRSGDFRDIVHYRRSIVVDPTRLGTDAIFGLVRFVLNHLVDRDAGLQLPPNPVALHQDPTRLGCTRTIAQREEVVLVVAHGVLEGSMTPARGSRNVMRFGGVADGVQRPTQPIGGRISAIHISVPAASTGTVTVSASLS
jgi:hypothetical protein